MEAKQPTPPISTNFAVTAAALEGCLAIFALSLGKAFGIAPMDTFHWSWIDLGWGAIATLPPLAIFGMFLYIPWEPFQQIIRLLDETFLPHLRDCGLFEIAVIAFLAGLGEEMLFRPIVQDGLAHRIGSPYGPAFGLAIAAIIFGMLHGVTRTYAIMAGVIGLYLGYVWLLTGNLLVPITAHALYDFVALVFLLRMQKTPATENAET